MVKGSQPTEADGVDEDSRQSRLFLCAISTYVGGVVIALVGGAVVVRVAVRLVVDDGAGVQRSWVWVCTASNKNMTDIIDTQMCLTIIQRGLLKSGI